MECIATASAVTNYSMTDRALVVASKYPVLPLRADKSPLTRRGFKDATRDEATIRAMFDSPAAELIGVPTGSTSGLLVFDIDPDGMSWLEENRHLFPVTRTHHTRRGGRHILFRHLEGVRCSAGKIATGVDVRGENGYVAWWPAYGLAVEYPEMLSELP
jgi:hypothetical protein